jgi:hypothetical protein
VGNGKGSQTRRARGRHVEVHLSSRDDDELPQPPRGCLHANGEHPERNFGRSAAMEHRHGGNDLRNNEDAASSQGRGPDSRRGSGLGAHQAERAWSTGLNIPPESDRPRTNEGGEGTLNGSQQEARRHVLKSIWARRSVDEYIQTCRLIQSHTSAYIKFEVMPLFRMHGAMLDCFVCNLNDIACLRMF